MARGGSGLTIVVTELPLKGALPTSSKCSETPQRFILMAFSVHLTKSVYLYLRVALRLMKWVNGSVLQKPLKLWLILLQIPSTSYTKLKYVFIS